MKSSIVKDIFREIKKSKGKFLSILFIVLIGVACFSGVKVSAPVMRYTADNYYKDNNLMDIQTVSNLGITDDDIKELRNIKGIKGLIGAHSKDFLTKVNGSENVVRVHSLNLNDIKNNDKNYINRLNLIEGKLPENKNECVVEASNLWKDIKIGDTLTLYGDNGEDIKEDLESEKYKIVGKVQSPYYVSKSKGGSSVGSGNLNSFVYLSGENFKSEVYTEAFITLSGLENYNSYEKGYEKAVKETINILENFGKERGKIRHDAVVKEATDEINDAKKELEDKKKEVYKELEDSKKELQNARKEIRNAENEISKQERNADSQIENGLAKLNSEENKLLNAERALKDQGISTNSREFQEIQYGKSEIQSQKEDLREEKANAKETISDAKAEIKKNKKKIEDGEIEYQEGLEKANKEFKEAEEEILENENKIKDIKDGKWYILDRNANYGFVDYGNSSDSINAIAKVFPIFFALVAALICLTTMTRMVDEQRINIGTLKGLGYSKFSIASKYVIYAALASFLGAIFGLIIGFTVFPTVIYNAYTNTNYSLPSIMLKIDIPIVMISILASVLITTFAAIFACYKELLETPSTLMRPKAPKSGKRILLERIPFIWNRINFIQKVTLRNLFRYKKRFLMTVIGISGCTALLVTGFGIRDSISVIADKQYGEIFKYNGVVNYRTEISKGDENKALEKISKDKRIVDCSNVRMKNIGAIKGDSNYQSSIAVLENTGKINDFINLNGPNGIQKITDKGVIITEKLAKLLEVKPGGKITLEDEDKRTYKVEVIGISENYVSHYIYMTPDLYKQVFLEDVKYNQLLIKAKNLNKKMEASISDDFTKIDNITAVNFKSSLLDSFSKMIESLNYAVILIITASGALAFVVLYNLTNINISERIREIATIKVLGFYDREVSSYVFRENMILTLLGGVCGLGLGILLHRFIIITVELEGVMFGRNVELISFLNSFIITVLFALVVNFFMYFKLKKIEMVESLKSVD